MDNIIKFDDRLKHSPEESPIEFPGLDEQDGDRRFAAFQEFARLNRERIVAYLMSRYRTNGALNFEDFVEAAHETLIRFYRRVCSDGWDARFNWAYLHRVADNQLVDRLRRLRRRQNVMAFESELLLLDDEEPRKPEEGPYFAAAADEEVRVTADNEELMTMVREMVESLPPGERSVAAILAANPETEIRPKELIKIYERQHPGEAITAIQIKGRLAAVRKKLRVVLIRYRRRSQ